MHIFSPSADDMQLYKVSNGGNITEAVIPVGVNTTLIATTDAPPEVTNVPTGTDSMEEYQQPLGMLLEYIKIKGEL